MNKGVNSVTILGNLGGDPEVRATPSGTTVTNFTVATSDSYMDKVTNERKENTEWHRVVMFGKLAEIAAEYLRKGSQVYLQGQLKTRKWTGNDGVERYTTEIKANEMQMLGPKRPVAPTGNSQRVSGSDVAPPQDRPF